MNRQPQFLELSLQHLYGADPDSLARQRHRYAALINKHSERFDHKDLHFFSAPGRTEIGGNHTDHNHGRVLAASTHLDSIAIASKTQKNEILLYSEGYPKAFVVDLNHLQSVESEKGSTSALIRGIACRLTQLGYQIGGFNASVASDVLPGSGLSSSASIEVLLGAIWNALFNEGKISLEELAQTGQFAENKYFGKPCGLMDQLACAVGGVIAIDFNKPDQPEITRVNFDFNEHAYQMLIIDTGGNHADLTDDYAAAPNEMKSVAREFGLQVCREIDMEQFIPEIKSLRKQCGDRSLLRVLHFLGENERVLHQVAALEGGDFKKFLELVKDSGNSSFKWLQNIYSVKNVREQSVTLALALTEYFISGVGEGACRVHGGGFAGTIQTFIPKDAVESYSRLMESVFGHGKVMALRIRANGAVHLNTLTG